MLTASFAQQSFQSRGGDTVALNSATFGRALNTNWTQAVDTVDRARFVVEETAGGGENVTWEVWFAVNGGTYAKADATTAFQGTASVQFTDEAGTTSVLGGSGAFLAGYGDAGDCTFPNSGNQSWSGSQYTEHELCYTLDSAQLNNGDTISLQLRKSGGVAITYNSTPTITVDESTPAASGSGDLVAGASSISGAGTSASAGSGALSAQATAVTGSGTSGSTGSGAPQAAGSGVSGSGASSSTGSGTLAASGAEIAGTGLSGSSGSGTVSASSAAVDGSDAAGASGSGALQAGSASASGAGTSGSGGSGTVIGASVTASGSGASGSTGTGAIGTSASSVSGSGKSASAGTGALAASAAAIAGSSEESKPGVKCRRLMAMGRIAPMGRTFRW